MKMPHPRAADHAAASSALIKLNASLSGRMKPSDHASGLRALLMGSVCAVGLVAGFSPQAQATPQAQEACNHYGNTLACSGDLALGVLVNPVYSNLTIKDVTLDVGSVGGVVGLRFDNDGDITVTSNTGDFAIVGQGTGLAAVHLSSFGGDYAVSLTQTGDVTSDDGTAVLATSAGDVSVVVTGDVSGKQNAIQAQSFTDGKATVVQTGNVISYQGSAISATASGAVDVTADGSVTAKQDAIYANNFGTASAEDVSVTTSGTIDSWEGSGINASSAYNSVKVDSGSVITAKQDGIHANSSGNANGGSVTVEQTGAITSSNGAGIFADSTYHSASVTSTGDIASGTDGIWAKSTGSATDATVTVTQTGKITSNTATGISAESTNRAVAITSKGDIQAKTDGIYARTNGTDALTSTLVLHQTGAIMAFDGYGMNALAAHESVVVTDSGAITAKQSGIHARSTGSNSEATVSVTHDGGLITSYDSYGIDASSSATTVTVTNTSDITSKLDGINATMTATNAPGSSSTVTQTGTILSYDGYGIYATATEAGVAITNHGTIQAKMGGLYGYASGGSDNATVTINNTGDISTYDGAAISAVATSQSVSVTQNAGNLTGGSYGIYAESKTKSASATINADGVVRFMNDTAVYLRGITGTTVTNYGAINGGDYELAIATEGYGGSVVDNYGTIEGAVTIDTGFSAFNNHLGAAYGVTDLAFNQGGVLTNDGDLSAGKDSNYFFDIHEAHVGGNLVQSSTGVLLIDASATEADKFVVAGNVSLNGGLRVQFSDYGVARSIDVLSSYWVDVGNLKLLKNTAVDATIRYTDTDVVLDYNGINFGATELTDTTRPIGDSLTAAYNADSTALDPLFTRLAAIPDDTAYQAALDQLTPNLVVSQAKQAQIGAVGFADSLMSCPAGSGFAFSIGQGSCVWGRGERVNISQDTYRAVTAYDAKEMNQEIGGQFALSEKLYLGLSLGSNNSNVDAGASGNSTQTGTQAGAALKYVEGAWLFSAALSQGQGKIDTTRDVTIGDFAETLESQRDVMSRNLRLRAANAMDLSANLYLKSVLDLNVTRVSTNAATETGGISELSYAAGSNVTYSLAPTLELGTKIAAADGLVVNPFIRVGAYGQFGKSQGLSGDFVQSEATDGSFTIRSAATTHRNTVALGVNLVKSDLGSLNLLYSRQIGDGADLGAIALKGTIRF